MHALGRRIGGYGKRHMLAIGALDSLGIVNGPDFLLGLIDKYRLLAALDTFLGAGRACSRVLGSAHGVGDIAVDLGGIGGAGRVKIVLAPVFAIEAVGAVQSFAVESGGERRVQMLVVELDFSVFIFP